MQNVLAERVPARLRRPARLLRLASDERLVTLVRGGDEGAFEALYDRHHPAILGFCRHMLGTREEAEDAVQHTFLSAFRDLIASDKPIELRPWLFAIARNRCLSLLRARRTHVAIELAEPATDGLTATVERREDLRELLIDLASLPEDQRAALLLAELGALDHAGIATVLGCPREKVKALVFQARTSLAASREARTTPCEQIRLELATATGAALRRGPLRRHLRVCAGCRAFKAEVATQRSLLALALPVAPSIALKASVLSGAVGGASASGGGGGAVGGGGLLGALASTGAGKAGVSLAVVGAVASGGALTGALHHGGHPPVSASVPAHRGASSPGWIGPASPPAPAPAHRHGAASGRHVVNRPPGAAPQPPAERRAHAQPQPLPVTGTAPGTPTVPAPGGTVRSPSPSPSPSPSVPSPATAPPPHAGTPPGHGGTPPGQAKKAPGQTTLPPGHGGTPPGQAKKQLEQSGGEGGDRPPAGGEGDASDEADTAPGHSGAAPGHNKDSPGRGD